MKKIFAMLFPNMNAGFVSNFYSGGKRTVDGALIHFNKALDELRIVKAQLDAEEQRHIDIAAAAEAKREAIIEKAHADAEKTIYAAIVAENTAAAEARRAAKAIAKIEDFVL